MKLKCILCQVLAASLALWFSFAHADVGQPQYHILPVAEKATPVITLPIDETRTIEMLGEVSRSSARDWIAEIKRLDAENRPFLIRISSPGGDIMPGIDVIKAIQDAKSPVTCVVDKYAASMAAFIFMSCPTREMHKLGVLMFHEYSTNMEGSRKQVKSQLALSEAIFEALMDELSRDSGIARPALDTLVGQDWWLNAKQADKYHLVSAIVDHYNVVRKRPFTTNDAIAVVVRYFSPKKEIY